MPDPGGGAITSGSPRTWPVVEVFGPTVQGEGPDAGLTVWFVRLGGCDFRCSWCDSMHAVEPARVREADRLTADGIVDRLEVLGAWERERPYIVLSGGNPALHHLGDLINVLHARPGEVDEGTTIAVETQGTIYRDWLDDVDRLVVSPKPPSSGMWTARHADQLDAFMGRAQRHPFQRAFETGVAPLALKVVIADETDYAVARAWRIKWHHVPFYLSVMTDQPEPGDTPECFDDDAVRQQVGDRYRWLCERKAADPVMDDVVVLPQLHVIAWGLRQGV